MKTYSILALLCFARVCVCTFVFVFVCMKESLCVIFYPSFFVVVVLVLVFFFGYVFLLLLLLLLLVSRLLGVGLVQYVHGRVCVNPLPNMLRRIAEKKQPNSILLAFKLQSLLFVALLILRCSCSTYSSLVAGGLLSHIYPFRN